MAVIVIVGQGKNVTRHSARYGITKTHEFIGCLLCLSGRGACEGPIQSIPKVGGATKSTAEDEKSIPKMIRVKEYLHNGRTTRQLCSVVDVISRFHHLLDAPACIAL